MKDTSNIQLTGHGLDGITVHVRGLSLYGGDLALRFGALLELGHLLTLHGRRCDLLSEDDVPDLASRQRGDVDAVALAEVLES